MKKIVLAILISSYMTASSPFAELESEFVHLSASLNTMLDEITSLQKNIYDQYPQLDIQQDADGTTIIINNLELKADSDLTITPYQSSSNIKGYLKNGTFTLQLYPYQVSLLINNKQNDTSIALCTSLSQLLHISQPLLSEECASSYNPDTKELTIKLPNTNSSNSISCTVPVTIIEQQS